MNFQYPWFLAALLCLAIPIIVHLFNFRKFKKILFTNLQFLKDIEQKNKKQRSIKHYLILFSRLLAVLFLVFAFCKPFFGSTDIIKAKGKKAISVYIDNSFSMNAITDNGPLLEIAKNKAREIAYSFNESDQFHLITNEFLGTQDRLISKEEFINKIDEIQISPISRNLGIVSNKIENFLKNSGSEHTLGYMISDFQKSFLPLEPRLGNMATPITLIALKPIEYSNIYIDTIWFSTPTLQPNANISISIQLKNSGNKDLKNGNLLFKVDGMQKSASAFDILANGSFVINSNFTVSSPGWHQSEIVINDNPIIFDDHFYASFYINSNSNVLCINDQTENKYINAALQLDPFFKLENNNSGNIDFSKINNYSTIILNGLNQITTGFSDELKKYVKSGGNLIVFPSINSLNQYQILSKTFGLPSLSQISNTKEEVKKIDYDHTLFKGVFEKKQEQMVLPEANMHFVFSNNSALPINKILTFGNGSPFLQSFELDKGQIFLWSSNLEINNSNLGSHALFIPMLYKMCFSSKTEYPLFYTIGNQELIFPDKSIQLSSKPYFIKNKNEQIALEKVNKGNGDFFSENNQVKDAGFFDITDPVSQTTIQQIAFNYNRKESKIIISSESEILASFRAPNFKLIANNNFPITNLVKDGTMGGALWKWMIIFTLLFLILETLIIKFWKKN